MGDHLDLDLLPALRSGMRAYLIVRTSVKTSDPRVIPSLASLVPLASGR